MAGDVASTGNVAVVEDASDSAVDYRMAIELLEAAVKHEVEQKQLPAFSISLVDGDRMVWAKGFGFQDQANKVPATSETVYRVGSVSKLFTDIAVMQLVEQGKLDLDAPVEQYLPAFKPQNPFGTKITMRQMMSHRSGLVRESPVGNYFDPTQPSLAETVASLNTTRLVYPPESKTKYSNAAIAVVGAVLESQLGVTHPEHVRREILDPLEMLSSGFEVTPDLRPKLATGWMRAYDGRRPFEAPAFLLGTGPAGNLYASVEDLAKFLVCLFQNGETSQGKIVQPATLHQMTTPVKDAEGRDQGFGIGFHIQTLDGYEKIGHGGAVYGFSTQLEAIPQRQVGVAAVASLDGANGVVGRLADYALRLMIAAKDQKALPAYPVTVSVSPARAKELVGSYRKADGGEILSLHELNGRVFLRLGSLRRELGADVESGSLVINDEFGYGIEVRLPSSDELLVGGSRYQRIDASPPAEPPARWNGLIGEYGWDHNVLYILEDHGQLYALIEWFYYYPLRELDENTFAFPDYGLYHGEGLKFHRDENGIATHVVAAEVRFDRRSFDVEAGETFKIVPVRPVDELRPEALAANPPVESGEFRPQELVELVSLDPSIRLDIRYATDNNFMGSVFYQQARAFMQRPAAEALVRVHRRLEQDGLGLLIHDAYRPWYVTKMFWDATPADMKDFVANPANGSRHNRGCAVDLTLFDRRSGEPIEMVAGYDEFSTRSFPAYPGGTSRQRWYRDRLRSAMEQEGFDVYQYEWWHFDHKDWQRYRIGNAIFEEMD